MILEKLSEIKTFQSYLSYQLEVPILPLWTGDHGDNGATVFWRTAETRALDCITEASIEPENR